jgi:2-oxoglutarate ferredoxin oxidoreductase subunit gamma
MPKRTELRLAGTADQNLALAGVILAEAAAIYEGKYASQSQSYGPEARSGASKTDVIISDSVIENPKTGHIDFLLALTDEACQRYAPDLPEGAVLVVDADLVTEVPRRPLRVYRLSLTRLAREKAGKESLLNIVALGAVGCLAGVVSDEALEQAVLARIPKGLEEETRRALHAGCQEARRAKEGRTA